jgi:hypothetical protein
VNERPHDLVRVRLTSRPDLEPYAEFALSESDLAGRVYPPEVGGSQGGIEHVAAEMAWGLTQLTVDEAIALASEGRIPKECAAQVQEYRAAGWPPMTPGQCADVTLGGGGHSMWRCTELAWQVVERAPTDQQIWREGGAELEAER